MAGVCYSLAFFCGYLFVFAFLGLFVYFLAAFEKDGGVFAPKKIFRKTLFFSLGFYIPLYSWFYALYPFEAFGFTMAEGIFIVIAADVGLGLFHSLINSASFCLLYLFPKKTSLLPVGAGCCMMISEFVISNLGFLSFPWGIAAVGQYRFLPFIQTVSLFGTYFIALIMGAFTCALAVACADFGKKRLVSAIGYIACPLLVGTFLLVIPSFSSSDGELTVACVQGNISSMEKWDTSRLNEIIETYRLLSEEAASSGVDLVVLPESAIPTTLTGSIIRNFTDIASEYGTPMIISGIVVENGKKYNSLLLINADGSLSGDRYDKRHLVPFGEYLPLKDTLMKILPFLGSINLSSSPFSAGKDGTSFRFENERLGDVSADALVCFDSIFPPLARSESDFIIVATNDSWYEDSPGVYQHEAQSVLRAVENGKWLVRCANTGVSCFVSPVGVISGELAPLTKGVTTRKIELYSGRRTLYCVIGDLILALPLGFIIYSIGYAVYRRAGRAKGKDEKNGNHQTL